MGKGGRNYVLGGSPLDEALVRVLGASSGVSGDIGIHKDQFVSTDTPRDAAVAIRSLF